MAKRKSGKGRKTGKRRGKRKGTLASRIASVGGSKGASRKVKHGARKGQKLEWVRRVKGSRNPKPVYPINPHGNIPIEVLEKRAAKLNKVIAVRKKEGRAYNRKVGA